MKIGWQNGEGWREINKPLTELCELIVDCEHKTAPTQEEGIPSIRTPNIGKGKLLLDGVYRVSEETYWEWTRRAVPLPGDLILAREAPAGNVAVIPENLKVCLGQRTVLIRPIRNVLEPEFLALLLLQPRMQQKLLAHSRGATVQHVNMKDIRALNIGSIPPLSVQKRIVSIIEEAFEGIATAKANAEKNLQNARAFFESYQQIVFTQRDEGWVEKSIGDCFKVRSGDFLPAKDMVTTGEVNVYGGNGIAGRHDMKNLSGDNIIIGRVGAKCGNVRHIQGDLWLTDNAFYLSEFFCKFDFSFLARLLERKQLRSTANQAAQPVVSYTTIKNVMLEFPVSEEEQNQIAQKLDSVATETQRLESIYQRKLTALDELKKSILHQAFSGQL